MHRQSMLHNSAELRTATLQKLATSPANLAHLLSIDLHTKLLCGGNVINNTMYLPGTYGINNLYGWNTIGTRNFKID